MSLELSLLYKQCGENAYMAPALCVIPKEDDRYQYCFANFFEKRVLDFENRVLDKLVLVFIIFYCCKDKDLTKTLQGDYTSSEITPEERLVFLRSVELLNLD